MKRIFFLVVAISLLASLDPCYGQEKDFCFDQERPLSPYAYRRMMRDHYNFTLMGSQTPVSGFKFETNKPTITLKGNITAPRTETGLLVNLELTGGVQNDFMQVFAGDQLNSYFKATVGFNKMLFQGNSAKYIMPDKFMKKLIRKKVCDYREEVARQIDTFLVLDGFESFALTPKPQLADMAASVAARSRRDEFDIDGYTRPFDSMQNEYYSKFIIALIKSYRTVADTVSTNDQERFEKFMYALTDTKQIQTNTPKITGDHKRLSKFKTDRMHNNRLRDNFEIEAYQDVWTSKRISWVNVSFSGMNSSFRLYDVGKMALTDSSSFLPGSRCPITFSGRPKKQVNIFLSAAE